MVIQVCAPTTDTKRARVDQFYEDLQDLTARKKKVVLFIIGDWKAKVGSQEILGVTGKFGCGLQNECRAKTNIVLSREHDC